MLYVFHGTNVRESGRKARALIDSLRKKKPDAAFEHLGSDDWNASILESHVGGQGLFSNKYIVFLDRLLENIEAKEKLAEFIPAIKESPNIFIILEGKISAEFKKAFDKNAEKVVVSDDLVSAKLAKNNDFNIFALADAVGARDSFKAWTIFREAIDNGLEAESILGTLFWQIKSMILASPMKSAGEAGLNPFVFGKSKRYAGNYSSGELSALSLELITLYHKGHRGMANLELATERFILNTGK